MRDLGPSGKSGLELSGDKWKEAGFANYRSANYPEYDICAGAPGRPVRRRDRRAGPGARPVALSGGAEHVADAQARRRARRDDPLHADDPRVPDRLLRWTETGMKYLMAECGFESRTRHGFLGEQGVRPGEYEQWPLGRI